MAFTFLKEVKIGRRTIQFGKPQFANEWGEIKDAPGANGQPMKPGVDTVIDDHKALGQSRWISTAKQGDVVKYTLQTLKAQNGGEGIENTMGQKLSQLTKDRRERAETYMKSGKIELSIVVRYGSDYKRLLAGNTRVTAQMEKFKEAYVWEYLLPKKYQNIPIKPKGGSGGGATQTALAESAVCIATAWLMLTGKDLTKTDLSNPKIVKKIITDIDKIADI